MSPDAPGMIATSIAGFLLPRLKQTHERRRIAVFSGPPGIGKSTALEALRVEHEMCVVLVSVPPGQSGGLKPAAALHMAVEALENMLGSPWRERVPNGLFELQRRLYSLVCEWAGISANDARRDGLDASLFAPLTLVFDEAQNLSREAIELLRFANDAKGSFSPLPLGLIFVGNNEFVLKSDGRGQSVLSAAVADRALYAETLSYADVTDADLGLFFEARGITDAAALGMIVRHFGAGRGNRSFRRAADLAYALIDDANGVEITADRTRDFLSTY